MIALRDMRAEDRDMIRDWRNLPEVAQYMYTDHQISPEEHERWFNKAMNDSTRRYWIITYDEEPVGLVNLYAIDEQNKRCHWAFYIASPDMRGKGVGSFVEYSVFKYVFEKLEFNKLCCEVLATNQPVVSMHEKFGFVQEGLFRQHVIKGGKPLDVVTMGILRDEWEAKRPELEARIKRIKERQQRKDS